MRCRSICNQQYNLLGTTAFYAATTLAGYEAIVPSNANAARTGVVAGLGSGRCSLGVAAFSLFFLLHFFGSIYIVTVCWVAK
jgi:hypothetical protein